MDVHNETPGPLYSYVIVHSAACAWQLFGSAVLYLVWRRDMYAIAHHQTSKLRVSASLEGQVRICWR